MSNIAKAYVSGGEHFSWTSEMRKNWTTSGSVGKAHTVFGLVPRGSLG